jgi:hypothetical protein
MMNIKIYQINLDRDVNNHKYLSLASTVDDIEKPKLDSTIYDEVFWGDVDAENLEDIFTKFNTETHPLHRGHSLSVSDIVKTDEGAFFCDSVGFKKVDFDESLTQKPDNLMKIVYVEPNRKPFVSEVEHKLDAEQKAVKGYIEVIYIGDNDVCLVGNIESKLMGMEGNRRIGESTIIAGPFFVVGLTEDDFRGLTDEEVEKYMEYFKEPHQISQEDVESDMGFEIYTF